MSNQHDSLMQYGNQIAAKAITARSMTAPRQLLADYLAAKGGDRRTLAACALIGASATVSACMKQIQQAGGFTMTRELATGGEVPYELPSADDLSYDSMVSRQRLVDKSTLLFDAFEKIHLAGGFNNVVFDIRPMVIGGSSSAKEVTPVVKPDEKERPATMTPAPPKTIKRAAQPIAAKPVKHMTVPEWASDHLRRHPARK